MTGAAVATLPTSAFPPDAPWAPAVATAPLSRDFPSDADWLLPLVDEAWTIEDGSPLTLDAWQRALIRALLEVYPAGHPLEGRLRYRQAVVSMGRQNGKSIIGAILGLYGLLRAGSQVLGIASTVDQAKIIYDRVRHVIETTPALLRRYTTTTTSARGIQSRDPHHIGSYVVKAGASRAVQGVPIWPLAIADELHLWASDVWDALVLSCSATGGSLFGISTAGDATSDLLIRLFERGRAAAAGDGADPRFGFFLWEAPPQAPVDDPQALAAANPAIACGRIPTADEQAAVRAMPENQARRYRLNQFVASESSWLPGHLWHTLPRGQVATDSERIQFAVTRDLSWKAATICAAEKRDGRVHVEVVASLTDPTIDALEQAVTDLLADHPGATAWMPAATLRELDRRLKDRGRQSRYLTGIQMQAVASMAYSLITRRDVSHDHAPVIAAQLPTAVAKNSGEGWIVSRRDSLGSIDAVEAMICGLYAAETARPQSPPLVVVGDDE